MMWTVAEHPRQMPDDMGASTLYATKRRLISFSSNSLTRGGIAEI
jgi:hypothetical protein